MANCCVCGQHTDIVCCSPLGTYSQAYCEEHLRAKISPYSDITTMFWLCGAQSLKDINPDFHEDIINSLAYHNKTIEDVVKDARDIDDDYAEHCKQEQNKG